MQELFLSLDFTGSVEETTGWTAEGGQLSGGWKNEFKSQSFTFSFSLLAFLVCQTGKHIFGPVLWMASLKTFVKCLKTFMHGGA